MVRRALSATLALLAACTAPQPFRAGAETPAPLGWLDYCVRTPADPDCAPALSRASRPGESSGAGGRSAASGS